MKILKFSAKLFVFFIFSAFFSTNLNARVNFSGIDLGADNRLLLRAVFSGDGVPDQSAVFLTRLPGTGIQSGVFPAEITYTPLSAFPEYIDPVENGRTLLVRNAFGAVRLPASGGLPETIPGLPSFTNGYPASAGRTELMAASPDGKWILYMEPTSAAYGKLIMLDTASGEKTEISDRIERPEHKFPASWSPDSRFFVYSKGNRLFFYVVTITINNTFIDERFRQIDEGSINSVKWGEGSDFYYLLGSTLYRVRGADLFARALYADFLEAGQPIGNIPFEFNHFSDRFWVSPDGASILVSQEGKNLFYLPLAGSAFNEKRGSALPYLALSQSCLDMQVLWPSNSNLTVIASLASSSGKNRELAAWRLNTISGALGVDSFLSLAFPGGKNYSGVKISPDGTKVLLWGESGIAVYDYASWSQLVSVSGKRAYSGFWSGFNEIITGDADCIERVRLSPESSSVLRRDLICLSQVDAFGFENSSVQSPAILARLGGKVFSTDGSSPWAETKNAVIRNASLSSSLYRVYLERQVSGKNENLPMAANVSSTGTFCLIPGLYPSTQGRRDIGLCFDLYDDDAGLGEILDALDRFGFRATFFLGGDFIRRYPEWAKQITLRGHEAASMFFGPIDLSDARYRVSINFIKQGLARNEDEFFRASGSKLALIWHPPFYSSSPEIVSAASEAGYITVNRDIDPLDWVSRDEEIRLGLPLFSAAEMIDRTLSVIKNGDIVPMRLGYLAGNRKEYFFNRINVLLDALVREGYSVVTVSELIKNKTRP